MIETSVLTKRLYTAKEASSYIGFPTAWPIRMMAWQGQIPFIRISVRRIAFDVIDLDKFISQNKQLAKKEFKRTPSTKFPKRKRMMSLTRTA